MIAANFITYTARKERKSKQTRKTDKLVWLLQPLGGGGTPPNRNLDAYGRLTQRIFKQHLIPG